MSIERFTSKFQSALASAQSIAVGKEHQYIEPIHLMLALIDQQGGAIRPLLTQAQVHVATLHTSLENAINACPKCKVKASKEKYIFRLI